MTATMARAIDGIPVVADTATRDTLYPTPTLYQRVQIASSGSIQMWNGSTWVDGAVATLPGDGRTVASLTSYLNNNATYNVKDFGAIGDGTTDDTAAIQLCFNTVCALINTTVQDLGAEIFFPRGTYLVTGTINVTTYRLHVRGTGKKSSTILFNPATAKSLFNGSDVANPGSLAQGSFSKMGFKGAGTQQKICFDMLDLSEYVFSELQIASSWTGNSGSSATPSIGFRISGRELCTFQQVSAFCDRPFHLRKGTDPNIGSDHYVWRDLYMNTLVAAESGILVDVDCIITNWTMEGYQVWVGGTYGIQTLASGNCIDVNIRNARYEQPSVGGGFAVKWQAASKCVLFEGCNFGGSGAVPPVNGAVYVRNVRSLTFINCAYTGSGGGFAVALDVDATVDDIVMQNFFAQATTTSTLSTYFIGVWSTPQIDSSAPFPPTGAYFRPASGALKTIKLLGVDVDYESFDIAAGALVNLVTNSQSMVSSLLEISGYSATGPIEEGGLFMVTASSAKAIAVTTNCAAGNVGGKLCVLWNSSASAQILNNTAQTLKVVMTLIWRR